MCRATARQLWRHCQLTSYCNQALHDISVLHEAEPSIASMPLEARAVLLNCSQACSSSLDAAQICAAPVRHQVTQHLGDGAVVSAAALLQAQFMLLEGSEWHMR